MQKSKSSSEQFKCQKCKKTLFSSNLQRAYYCCDKVQLTKIFCYKCIDNNRCSKCPNKQSKKKIDITKEQAKLSLIKLPTTKKQSQYNEKQNKKEQCNPEQCYQCHRNFKKQQILYFEHFSCKKRFCYSCIYQVYKLQRQKQIESEQKNNNQKELIMNCCSFTWSPLSVYEQTFRSFNCVFCGVESEKRKCMFQIENRFRFCKGCYLRYSTEKYNCASIVELIKQIKQTAPTECIYCESKISIYQYSKDYQMMKKFNRKLCQSCYNHFDKMYSSNVDLLKHYPALTVSSLQASIQQMQQKQCKICKENPFMQYKGIIGFKTLHVKFDLIIWRDNNIYCGTCLYFNFQLKRKLFLQKSLNPLSVQICQNQFQAIRSSYQNNFNQRCIICSTTQRQKNNHKLLLDQKNNLKQLGSKKSYLLSINCCRKCLKKISQVESKSSNMAKLRKQIQTRDQNLKYMFKRLRQKDSYLLDESQPKIFNSQKKRLYNQFWKKSNEKIPQKTQQVKKPQRYVDLVFYPNANENKNEDLETASKLKQKQLKNNYNFDKYGNRIDLESTNYYKAKQIKDIKKQLWYEACDGDEFEEQNKQKFKNNQIKHDNNQKQGQIEQIKYDQIIIQPINVKLSVQLKSYDEIMKENQKQELSYSQSSINPKYKDKLKYLTVFQMIKDDMTKTQVISQVFNLPINQSLKTSSHSISNNDNTCKILRCKNKNTVLNLGLMCDNCFMLYLMGEIALKDQMNEAIYNKQVKQLNQQNYLIKDN